MQTDCLSVIERDLPRSSSTSSMMSRMRKRGSTAGLAVLLAFIAGAVCFLWQVHDLGGSCGYGPGSGLPTFPVVTALVVWVASPTLMVGAMAVLERRRRREVAAIMILAAMASAAAFVIALFVFWSSRGCFR